MKRILAFAFATLILITLTACGGGKKTPEDLIVGSWVSSAPTTMNEGGMTITFSEMSANYAKDKTATGAATMKMSGNGLPIALEMSMTSKSTWVIEGDQLKETVTDADIKMLTEIPGMPDLSGMMAQQMKAQGAKSVTIIKLDKKTFEFKDEESGLQVSLNRK